MQCEVCGCEREAKTIRFGHLCLLHYKRYFKYGNVETNKNEERIRNRANQKCKVCDRKVGKGGALGYCNKHYQMFRKWGDALHFDKRVRPTSYGYYRVGKRGQGEHRKIYEDFIGRKLLSSEVVHHIDFNRTNNKIENLYLYESKSEHTRQHCNYRKLLQKYRPEDIIFRDGAYYPKI